MTRTAASLDGIAERDRAALVTVPDIASGRDENRLPVHARRRRWERRYVGAVLLTDAVAVGGSVTTGLLSRFGRDVPLDTFHGVGYAAASLVVALGWLLLLAANRAYEPRFLGTGAEEFKRVWNACFGLAATVAIVSYGLKLQVARGFVAVAFPLGTTLSLLLRYAVRKVVHRLRDRGLGLHRLLVVGDPKHIADLVQAIRRDRYTGYDVVGACVPGIADIVEVPGGTPVAVLGSLTGVVAAIRTAEAEAVAVTASPGVTSAALRRLGWELEGSGIDLIVAPALTDVAGPRISMRPVAGLPLLHVEEPEIAGFWHILRSAVYWLTAAALVVPLSPVLAAIAGWIKLDSSGPVLFRQTRVGLGGRLFTVYKFRTMAVDAEQRLGELHTLSDGNGMLFKMREDPRVTRVGRLLRRFSLDELPQLFNVLRGDMALVGPRPPLPREVEQYADDVRRRLLVKPGITGLWQVSGRSDLSWEESVRLDLYYVENWSPLLDVQILWKTVFAVVRGSGAY